MQFQSERNEAETISLLRNIEKRLADLAPTASEMFAQLEPDSQKAIIDNIVDKTSLGEVYDFVAANPELSAKRRAKDEASKRATIERAKMAGLRVDTRLDDASRVMHEVFEVDTA